MVGKFIYIYCFNVLIEFNLRIELAYFLTRFDRPFNEEITLLGHSQSTGRAICVFFYLRACMLSISCILCYCRSLWKHFRAVSLCLFLLIFPAYMAYMICQFFRMDFWLLIIISSSILTSLQVHEAQTQHIQMNSCYHDT